MFVMGQLDNNGSRASALDDATWDAGTEAKDERRQLHRGFDSRRWSLRGHHGNPRGPGGRQLSCITSAEDMPQKERDAIMQQRSGCSSAGRR